jgi:hypothetical protein
VDAAIPLSSVLDYRPNMPSTDNRYWTTDEKLFASFEGAKELVEWFGFIPSFHDATLEKLEIADRNAVLSLKSFRMTNAVDASGFSVLDKHALVGIQLDGITGISLSGDATSIISDLGVRRVSTSSIAWRSVAGPGNGDVEVSWESSVGLEGSIFARSVRFSLQPG